MVGLDHMFEQTTEYTVPDNTKDMILDLEDFINADMPVPLDLAVALAERGVIVDALKAAIEVRKYI